jgi:zinc transport system ATP-binding protein
VVGLAERAGSDVAELSGGQQRRVLVARALAAEPEVLVMDEPTAGVDASQQVALARALASLRARKVTLLVVTHEIGPLAPVLDRCVVLDEGRVTHDGPLAEHLLHVHDHAHHLDEHHDHAPGWVAEPRTR